ncbi:MAG: IS6 family transposase, partial [Bacteroidetes bacterium]|nr:IS6 family transposase [Bacteroidota bacterium]
PAPIISHTVWLYFRFTLSFRDIEELLAARNITVSYETIRQWCQKFGQKYSHRIKKSRGPLGDTWYLDEVFIKINGVQYYLWRAVDQDGDELDILVQKHAQRFLACHGVVNNLFRLGRHMMKAKNYRTLRNRSFVEWVAFISF